MAKRAGDNFPEQNQKKQKFDNYNDSLWEDDVDDDCFEKFASQILGDDSVNKLPPTQGINSSILPSYESFKPHVPFASTQSTFISKAQGTQNCNNIEPIVEDLKIRIKYLEQKCEAKEGEVSILRTQMQKIKTEMLENQNKKQKEYIEVISLKDKELKSFMGELEFKNLEIANLKQVTMYKPNPNLNNCPGNCKLPGVENVLRTMSPSKGSPVRASRNMEKEKSVIIDTLQEPNFPLLTKLSPRFFETIPPEIHILEHRINQQGRNTIPYLHNQIEQEECILPSGPKVTVTVDKKLYGLEYIYPEMFKLMQSDMQSLNSTEINESINKILAMSIQLLEFFKQYLEVLEKSYKMNDAEELDKSNLQSNLIKFDPKVIEEFNTSEHEIGISAGRTVEFVAVVMPYCSHLAEFVMADNFMDFDENIINYFSCLKNINKRKSCYLLLINDILRKILLLKKTEVCNKFLNAVGLLLLNISRHDYYNKVAPLFNSLFGSLLYTRPSMEVLHKLLIVVKNCCKYKPFLEFLCQQPMNQSLTADKKKKIRYFGEDTCKFTVFMTFLRNQLPNVDEEKRLDITVNILSIVYNLFEMNPSWMYDSHLDACACLEKLYELVVDVLYRTFQHFKNNRYSKLWKGKYILVFKSGIEVFQLLSFNSYGLMDKCIESHSKYREICSGLLEFENELSLKEEIEDLRKLNICEDVPNVPSANFNLL